MPQNRELDGRLLMAAANDSAEVVRRYFREGADAKAVDTKGRTGLHLAILREGYTYASVNTREIVAAFLNRGLDINTKDDSGATVLHVAVQDEHYGVGQKLTDLLTFGAEVEARDSQGRVPMHYAAQKGYQTEAISQLINAGARVDVADEQGVTPLHLAAQRGDASVIRAFLVAGADVSAVTKDGRHVWDFAVEGGQDYQAQVLKAEAAKQKREAERKQAERERVQQKEAERIRDPWTLLAPDRVANMTVDKQLGYKLTEIFNFSARTYTQITHNLSTKSEAVAVRTFDEFSDKTPIEKAHAALHRLGGTAQEALISGPALEKPKRNFKLGSPPAG